ncbi:MAG: biopolymer transporter ExbD [Planctomycetales bacterium]|nr:biopolymer transporter ExbD [Planctomycetales bacterium]MBN8628280.1 biopolymer transporter ExbD [Planctomycetota bacterium]
MPKRQDVKAPEKIDINMTPMIDVVFQLMAFFLMTFKVASTEGDFNLKLPKAERSAGAANTQTEMINVVMRANAQGDLMVMQVDAAPPARWSNATDAILFSNLRSTIDNKVSQARDAGQEEPEIQIDADDNLRYEFVIKTIDAVSAKFDAAGNYQQLAKKVKFAPK